MPSIRVTLCIRYIICTNLLLFVLSVSVQRQQQPGKKYIIDTAKPDLVPYGQDAAQGTLLISSTAQQRAVLRHRASS